MNFGTAIGIAVPLKTSVVFVVHSPIVRFRQPASISGAVSHEPINLDVRPIAQRASREAMGERSANALPED
jgi:hypothetical protein